MLDTTVVFAIIIIMIIFLFDDDSSLGHQSDTVPVVRFYLFYVSVVGHGL